MLPVSSFAAVSFGIQKLNPVGIDEILVVLCACLFVVPGLCTLAALDINTTAFVQVFADNLCEPSEGLYGEPFCVFLQPSVFACPSFARCYGKLRDRRPLLAVLHLGITAEVSDQHDLLHVWDTPFEVIEMSARCCYKSGLIDFLLFRWGHVRNLDL